MRSPGRKNRLMTYLGLCAMGLLFVAGILDAHAANAEAFIEATRHRIVEISREAPSDAEALARFFEDSEIPDDETAVGRFEAILLATCQVRLAVEHGEEKTTVTAKVQTKGIEIPVTLVVPDGIGIGNPNDLKLGVPLHKGMPFRDRGFRQQFRDGSNQVGHFLTAARLGYDHAFILNPFVQFLLQGTGGIDDAIRIIIGHEQVENDIALSIDPFGRFAKELRSPTDAEVTAFKRGNLDAIRIGSGPGQSRPDMELSYVGWTLGNFIRKGTFRKPEEIATWIRVALTEQ